MDLGQAFGVGHRGVLGRLNWSSQHWLVGWSVRGPEELRWVSSSRELSEVGS